MNTRSKLLRQPLLVLLFLTMVAAPAVGARQATPLTDHADDRAVAIVAIAEKVRQEQHLRAVILRVDIAGEEIVSTALGESMTGVPATTEMHFRNGAVAYSYLATLLLQLVDEGNVSLDDPIATWLPDLPDADRVTLRMLANMTSGYPDYVQNPKLDEIIYVEPFRQWTSDEMIELGLSMPRMFAPGTNWDYSHTGYVILGQAIEAIAGQPMETLMQERIFAPLGLKNTQGWLTAEVPVPVLHTFSSERRQILGVPASTRFYEEATFWNPSWTIGHGAAQTTNIEDMIATAVAVGEGTLLSPESHAAQIAPDLIGFGTPLKDCANCRTLNEYYHYGLGVVLNGRWQLQDPLFAGCGAVEAYLPGEQIAIAVATTYTEASFDDQGNYLNGNGALPVFVAIANYLAPGSSPQKP